jgi:hypothetical protein
MLKPIASFNYKGSTAFPTATRNQMLEQSKEGDSHSTARAAHCGEGGRQLPGSWQIAGEVIVIDRHDLQLGECAPTPGGRQGAVQ